MMSSILRLGQGPPTQKGVLLISNEFDAFLSEMIPSLGLCPPAFRRRNIRGRIVRRMESVGIHEFQSYRELVRHDPTCLPQMLTRLPVGGGGIPPISSSLSFPPRRSTDSGRVPRPST